MQGVYLLQCESMQSMFNYHIEVIIKCLRNQNNRLFWAHHNSSQSLCMSTFCLTHLLLLRAGHVTRGDKNITQHHSIDCLILGVVLSYALKEPYCMAWFLSNLFCNGNSFVFASQKCFHALLQRH